MGDFPAGSEKGGGGRGGGSSRIGICAASGLGFWASGLLGL